MSNRNATLLLSLLVAFGTACGDDADPSKSNNTVNNTANNTATNNKNNTTNNTSNNETTNNTTNNTTTPTNNNSNNNTTSAACLLLPNFFGQINPDGEHTGGAPDPNGVLTYDAGLAAVYAAVPLTSDDDTTEGVDEGRAEVDLQVTGALVIATTFDNFANATFWLQDKDTAIRVRLDDGATQETVIKVGQKISFHVSAVLNYAGTPQIALLDTVVVDSAGNPVPFREATGTDLTAADVERNVRIAGTVSDAGTICGGTNKCFAFKHGDKTTTLRTKSQFIEMGDCLTFVGPASSNPGSLGSGTKTIQIDQVNFNWAFEQR